MDELRRDVNEAFDKGQPELGDLSGVRERIVRQTHAARRTPTAGHLQLAAGLAAVLIAAVAIATFAYVRSGQQPSHGPGPARPSASPTPLSKPLNVSTDTPVLLYYDPANADQLDGMTWDGKQSGRVDWALGLANPSATLFTRPTEILDRSGRVVVTGNFGLKGFSGTWADDGFHFCQMVPFDHLGAGGVPATLQLVTPGSKPRSVARVGMVYEQAVLRVAACSVRKDRAVVVQGYGNSVSTAQYWVVQLSTGKVLWTHRFDISRDMTIVVSPDGQLIAEDDVGFSSHSVIYGAYGSALLNLNAHVDAFSADDSLVVMDDAFGLGHLTVHAWGGGGNTSLQAPIWSAPAGYSLSAIEAQPDGSTLAIWMNLGRQGFSSTLPDLYVIASDGKVIAHISYPPT
jgi:hypothetical protein